MKTVAIFGLGSWIGFTIAKSLSSNGLKIVGNCSDSKFSEKLHKLNFNVYSTIEKLAENLNNIDSVIYSITPTKSEIDLLKIIKDTKLPLTYISSSLINQRFKKDCNKKLENFIIYPEYTNSKLNSEKYIKQNIKKFNIVRLCSAHGFYMRRDTRTDKLIDLLFNKKEITLDFDYLQNRCLDTDFRFFANDLINYDQSQIHTFGTEDEFTQLEFLKLLKFSLIENGFMLKNKIIKLKKEDNRGLTIFSKPSIKSINKEKILLKTYDHKFLINSIIERLKNKKKWNL